MLLALCTLLFAYAAPAFGQFYAVDNDIDAKRRYDQVTFMTSHNAFSVTTEGWIYAQQALSIPLQLQLGVRGLMLDIHLGQGGVVEKQCRDVRRQVSKTENQCKNVTRQDCHNEKKVKEVCKEVSKEVCKNWPFPLNYACKTVTETVCTPTEVVEQVCKNVDDVVCTPVTVLEWVTETVCDVANVIPSGEKRVRLCHDSKDSNCLWTRTLQAPGHVPRPLADALTDIRKFLDGNSNAIVTLFFESYVNDKGKVDHEFAESGINKYLFDQDAWFKTHSAWPTIQAMRASNQRLVVFTGDGDDGRPNNWDYVIETEYDLGKYRACELRKESRDKVNDAKASLLTINHFYKYAFDQPYVPVAAAVVNNPVEISARIAMCKASTKRTVNFIALDFVNSAVGVWPIIKSLNTLPR